MKHISEFDIFVEDPERVIVREVERAINDGYEPGVGVGVGLSALRDAGWELAWFEEDSDIPLRRWEP
jgi:hypothetical protein